MSEESKRAGYEMAVSGAPLNRAGKIRLATQPVAILTVMAKGEIH
jgi:hypothetical protein